MINPIDVYIVIIYLALCLIVGLHKAKCIKDIKEYTLGKGNFPTVVMVGTLFATGISSSTTIGGIGVIYSLNPIYIIATLFKPLSWIFASIIYSRKNSIRSCLTLPEVMGKLYGSGVQSIVSLAVICAAIGFLAVQITAIANILSQFGVEYTLGVIICSLVLILYSTLGGIQAVALTDLLQFFIFFLIFPLVCIKSIENIGGAGVFFDKLQHSIDINVNFTLKDYIMLLGMSLYFIPAEAPFIQRVLMQKKRKKIFYSFLITGIISSIFYITVIAIGLITRLQVPNIKGNMELLHFTSHNLSSGFVGLMLCSLLAIIMSTADSYLNTISVIISRDIVSKIFP